LTTDQGSIQHILKRALLHFGLSIGLYAGCLALVKWLADYEPTWVEYLWAGVLLWGIIAPREAVDVAKGQPLLKVFTDWASWASGAVFSVFLFRWLA
jgi:hypothetical protein